MKRRGPSVSRRHLHMNLPTIPMDWRAPILWWPTFPMKRRTFHRKNCLASSANEAVSAGGCPFHRNGSTNNRESWTATRSSSTFPMESREIHRNVPPATVGRWIFHMKPWQNQWCGRPLSAGSWNPGRIFARSSSRAISSKRISDQRGPTICRPIGRPSPSRPAGTASAG